MLKNYKHQKKELQQPVSFVNIFLILISHRNIFPLKVLEKWLTMLFLSYIYLKDLINTRSPKPYFNQSIFMYPIYQKISVYREQKEV